MPKSTSSNSNAKFSSFNGYYCYAHKVTILTNSFGIVCHVNFYNNSLIIDNANSADKSKNQYDVKSRSFIAVLNNFFYFHPGFSYRYFLGDAGFYTA